MKQVRWESTEGDSGAKQVNVIGLITVEGKQATAEIEFLVHEGAGNQRFGALKIDGETQQDDVAAGLLSAMCAAAGGGPAAGGASESKVTP